MYKLEQITCKKCSTVNPLYTSICINCKSYLRERFVNIDLWKTIGQIIESPKKAFTSILFAENKNFVIFLTLLFALKNLIITRFFSVPTLGQDGVQTSTMMSYIIIFAISFLILSIFTFIQKIYYHKLNVSLRFKDIYATTIYSFTPYILSLISIFIIELVVLGGDIFSNNPTPFQIKPTIAYTLTGFEVLVFLWSILLFIRSVILITGKIILPIILALIFTSATILAFIFSAKYIFII